MKKYQDLLAPIAETEGFVAAAVRVKDGFYVKLHSGEEAKVSFEEKCESIPVTIIQKVFCKKPKVNGIIIADMKHISVVGKAGVNIPPVLDDFAQIVGPGVKTGEVKKALCLLKGRNACILKNIGALSTGRTLDEADTALKVLEKTAKVYIEADVIGGAKSISKWEARLMNIIYRLKYSKSDQDAKLEEIAND